MYNSIIVICTAIMETKKALQEKILNEVYQPLISENVQSGQKV